MRSEPSVTFVDAADLVSVVYGDLVADQPEAGQPRYGQHPAPHEIVQRVRAHAPLLDDRRVRAVADAVVARMRGLGPLEPLLADPAISEVMINGPGPVWVEAAGSLEVTDIALDAATIGHLVEKIVAPLGLRADRSSPLVDARLADGSRVNVVVPPLAIDGPYVTIRRFRARPVVLAELCPPGVADFLSWAVRSRCNVVVAGGTGAGKTTLLNALAAIIPVHDRIITIEDAAELQLTHKHVVRMEARPPNADGAGEVPIRELVRNALRMRPDRIIVGECRGPEALDMLQAMNSGHEGSLSTCHANSPGDALFRLETMVLMGEVALPLTAVRDQLHAALDFIVQIARRPAGERRVVGVAEVAPRWADGGELHPTASSTEGPSVRLLADSRGLMRLPSRRPRVSEAEAPDRGWLRS